MNGIIALATAIALAVGSQLIFKYGATRIPVWEGSVVSWMDHMIRSGIPFALFLYFISAILYIYALRFIPLSIASPSIAIS
ncbi:MAG: hypothetical protein P8171_17870 [Candidatus Thiodiazotropha sp.]